MEHPNLGSSGGGAPLKSGLLAQVAGAGGGSAPAGGAEGDFASAEESDEVANFRITQPDKFMNFQSFMKDTSNIAIMFSSK